MTIQGKKIAKKRKTEEMEKKEQSSATAKAEAEEFLRYRSWKTARGLQRRPKRIILIRHGESMANIDADVYATVADNQIGLSARGVEQATEAGKKLRELVKEEDVAFFVSPFVRSRMTLDAILKAGAFQCPAVREDPRLREQEWYLKQTKQTNKHIQTHPLKHRGNFQNPETMPAKMETRRKVGCFYYRFSEGESGADVYDRVSSFLETLFREFKKRDCARNVVLVSHGITLRLFLTRYFRWTIEVFHDLWNLGNCEMVVLERPELSKAFALVTQLRSNNGLYREWTPSLEKMRRCQSLIGSPVSGYSTVPPPLPLSHTLTSSTSTFEFPPCTPPESPLFSPVEPPPQNKHN